MKPLNLLVTSHAGPPDNPRTWSGTAHSLLQSLKNESNVYPHGHHCNARGLRKLSAAKLDRICGLTQTSLPGRWQRVVNAKSTKQQAVACDAILHLGTYDIQKSTKPSYVYVDNSFDIWARHSRAGQRLNSRARTLLYSLERQALQRARHVFTIGEHVAANIHKAFGLPTSKLSAIGSGMGDIQPWNGPKDYTQGNLLIVAKLRPYDKGVGTLLEAFKLARKTRPDLNLTIIGGAHLSWAQGIDGVTATGWISAEELQTTFNRSTLFVMPAQYEPWGLAYLEALACRTPIMGLPHLALPEMTAQGQYGHIVDDDSADTLSQAILDALAQPEKLAEMGRLGQQACLDRYRWDKVASQIVTKIRQDLAPMEYE